MQRLRGVCPGTVLRAIDETVTTCPPLLTDGNEAVYRLTTGAHQIVAVVGALNGHIITVMTVPCEVHCNNRTYEVGADSLMRTRKFDPLRNVNKTKYVKKRNREKWNFAKH